MALGVWELLTQGLDVDIQPNEKGEYTASEETGHVILIYDRFPNLKKCNRSIKKLIIIPEMNKTFETSDFDKPGSLIK